MVLKFMIFIWDCEEKAFCNHHNRSIFEYKKDFYQFKLNKEIYSSTVCYKFDFLDDLVKRINNKFIFENLTIFIFITQNESINKYYDIHDIIEKRIKKNKITFLSKNNKKFFQKISIYGLDTIYYKIVSNEKYFSLNNSYDLSLLNLKIINISTNNIILNFYSFYSGKSSFSLSENYSNILLQETINYFLSINIKNNNPLLVGNFEIQFFSEDHDFDELFTYDQILMPKNKKDLLNNRNIQVNDKIFNRIKLILPTKYITIDEMFIYQYLSYENDKTLISKILYNSEKLPSLITGSI